MKLADLADLRDMFENTPRPCQVGIIAHTERGMTQPLPPKRTLRTSACKCVSAVVT